MEFLARVIYSSLSNLFLLLTCFSARPWIFNLLSSNINVEFAGKFSSQCDDAGRVVQSAGWVRARLVESRSRAKSGPCAAG